MKILSLFDGIACGRVALERCGFDVETYDSFEIDENAMKVANTNYPDIRQHGSVVGADFTQFKGYDLLMGGSPCQGFSSAGKGLNFNDPRSKLFFEFVRALKEAEPKYFLLENVKMKRQHEDIITDYLGVEPICINSSLVSAQNRVRLYWTNIPNVGQPKDRYIFLEDIIDGDDFGGDELHKATIVGRRLDRSGHRQDYNKEIPITQCLEVRKSNNRKVNCLTTVGKDNVLTPLPFGRHVDAFGLNGRKLPWRYLNRTECERLQTLPDGYTSPISESQAKRALGNGWTVDVIAHILKNIKD
jgi:DNA-cytosine methyltransferase